MIDLDSTEGYSGQTQASTLTSPTLRKTSLRWNPLGGSGVGWGGVCTNLDFSGVAQWQGNELLTRHGVGSSPTAGA